VVDTADLIKQIMKVSGDFNASRKKYLTAHPTFSKEKGARLIIYGRTISSIDMALVYLMFRTFQLPSENWWSDLTEHFRNNKISPTIFWIPNELNRARITQTIDNYWI
jgi:hypothetical protein